MLRLFQKKPVVRTLSLQDRATAVVDNLKTDLLLLNQEATDALDAFQRTITRLGAVNDQITEKKTIAQAQITELTQLVSSFDKAQVSNAKVIGKIQDLLS